MDNPDLFRNLYLNLSLLLLNKEKTEVEITLSVQEMNSSTRFIVIDDDPLNNTICRLTIKKALGEVDVVTFTDPKEGLDYIGNEYAKDNGFVVTAVLFLDINMPIMNGWEFLEKYENLEHTVKNRIKVYILSSSVDERDIEKANSNKNIVNYLPKPIKKEMIINIADYKTDKKEP